MGIACEDQLSGKLSMNLGILKLEDRQCDLKVDVRCPVHVDLNMIWKTIELNCRKYELKAEYWQKRPPLYIPKEAELVQILLNVFNEMTGMQEEPIVIGGGTYCRDVEIFASFGPVFPGEPILTIKAPLIQAQFAETALLNIINHQTLIATKAAKICRAANGGVVMEFGLRRAQGPDAGIYGARAAIIGGCAGTSNVLTGQMYDMPAMGTHAHSWVMSFPTELDAFRKYAELFPTSCLLLVDTYDTLRSGVPNAITVFRELRERGYEPKGIRLDSGDLAYLSREARKMLDEAGFPNAIICASGDLDENLIRDLKLQGAAIDTWGVGTKLITSEDCPSLGGVYKLSAEYVDGQVVPKMKISENEVKITNPGVKKLYRIYDKDGMAVADLIALEHEHYDTSKPLTIYDPVNTWKSMTLTNYTMKELQVPLFRNGERVYQSPSLMEIQQHCREELSTFWDQYKRLLNPHRYKVDLSDSLWMLKNSMLQQLRRG